jgi:hypothetical protein
MTVNDTGDRITYAANGSTTLWNFDFPGVDPSNIFVFITDNSGVATGLPVSAFTVTLNNPIDPNPTSVGGSVLYPKSGSPLALGNQITILRSLEPIQSVSLANQSVIYPPVIEEEFDYLTLLFQQGTGIVSRAFRVGPEDPIPAIVPSVGIRANHQAFFDTDGNLVPGEIPGSGVFISAVMIPVVEAATLTQAQINFGLGPSGYSAINGSKNVITNTYTILESDKGKTLQLQGNAFYAVTVDPAVGYPPDYQVLVFNDDTRGKFISIPGRPSFIMWPGQGMWIVRDNAGTAWLSTTVGRWRPQTPVNFFVNYALGTDSGDGLATGAQAWKTIQHACDVVQDLVDGNFTINLADGTHQLGVGVTINHPVIGADGFRIVGNVVNPGAVILAVDSGRAGIRVTDNAVLYLAGVLIAMNTGASTSQILSDTGAVVTLDKVWFGTAGTGGVSMKAMANGMITVMSAYTILASSVGSVHVYALSAGTVTYNPSSVTIQGAINFEHFLAAAFGATIYTTAGPPAFGPGGNAGDQYTFNYNASGSLAGAVIPGTPGSVSNGGVFL